MEQPSLDTSRGEQFWKVAAAPWPPLSFFALIKGELEGFVSLDLMEATSEPLPQLILSEPTLFRIALKVRTLGSGMRPALILIDREAGTFARRPLDWTYQPKNSPLTRGTISEVLPYMCLQSSTEGRRHFVRGLRIAQQLDVLPFQEASLSANLLRCAITHHCVKV